MLREPFFYIMREWAVDDFDKALFGDVSKRNFSAVVEATGDNATIVENRYVRVKCTACACDDFAVRSFDSASVDALLRMTIVAVLGLRRRPLETSVFVQIKSTGYIETLVATAEMPGRDINAKSLVDAFKHVAVPRGGIFGADVPQS